ncbi:hypothetical protein [Allosphingosinicella sp.]|uniref:hypothetical protein n=1 Tax=Allosphingosinicella sp. TaxID=2823234 RepID=UPI003783A648
MKHLSAIAVAIALAGCSQGNSDTQKAEIDRLRAETEKLRAEAEQLRQRNEAPLSVDEQIRRHNARAFEEGMRNASAAPARPQQVRADTLVGNISNFMTNPSIGLANRFAEVRRAALSASGGDGLIDRREADSLIAGVNGLNGLPEIDKRAIVDVINSTLATSR